MKICKACGTPLLEGEKFCNNCGEEYVEQPLFCPKCKAEICADSVFCEKCGASLAATPAVSNPEEVSYTAPENTEAKEKTFVVIWKKLPKKILAICLAAAIVISAAAIFLPDVFDRGNDKQLPELLLYLKDNEINYSSLKSIEPAEITERLARNRTFSEDEIIYLSYYTIISKDEKLIFYPDKILSNSNGFSLYYKSLKNADEDGEKIDSDVKYFRINEDASKVFYLTADYVLYIYDFSESEEIDDEVMSFVINKDGSKLLYTTTERKIYLKDGNNEKEKIDSDASLLSYTEDFKKIYYTSDGTLYCKEDGKDKVEIDSDVTYIKHMYDTGELYYTKSKNEEKKLSDYVIDDKAEEDAQITAPNVPQKPVPPEYPSYGDYDSWDAYYAAQDEYNTLYDIFEDEYDAYNEAFEEYQAEYQVYEEKRSRDMLRDQLKQQTTQITNATLYFYNGTEAKVVSENFLNSLSISNNSAMMVFNRRINTEQNKLKLSEINSASDVYNITSNYTNLSVENCVAFKSDVSLIEINENKTALQINFNYNANKIYFIECEDVLVACGDLYEIAIKDNALGEKTLYDEDVYRFSCIDESDSILYYKNQQNFMNEMDVNSYPYYDSSYTYSYDTSYASSYETSYAASYDYSYDNSTYYNYNTCDLYLNKNCIDSNVYFGSVEVIPETEAIVYLTEYDPEDGSAILKIYTGNESKEIAEDVHDFYAVNEKCIAYLQDYNKERAEGDAYLYDGGGESELIDEDVTGFIDLYFDGMSPYLINLDTYRDYR